MKVSPEQVARVLDLYNQGYYLQAYRFTETVGPLAEWEGTAAMLAAGRLASNVGSPTLARQLHSKAYRLDRGDGEAAYYKARMIHEQRGPLAAWNFLKKTGETLNASATTQSDWLAFHAIVLGTLRDFDGAEEWLAKAEKLNPTNPWIWVEHSHLHELEDKYEEALDVADRSLQLRPYFRPGLQSTARILVLLGRDDEALGLLQDAVTKVESCWLTAQLAHLQNELNLHAEARQTIERFTELAPLRSESTEQWLNAQRADTTYLCGDWEAALRFTELSRSPFHKLVVERMQAAGEDAKRVLLPLGFVRQHHMTCAPATLTLISRFWKMAADHLSVVEAICYDGTPARSERDWAEREGWFVREFCVNWKDTVCLIDRGVPFTLITVEPSNAHEQAVIGYDSRRGTILARDPYERTLVEYAAMEMFERYRSSGPRGMAMVPLAQKHLLEGIELRDAALYDALYQVQQALYSHDRAGADEILVTMAGENANHRLTHQAQLAVAAYDSDDVRVLACLEKLLSLFPDDANLKVSMLSVLRRLARRQDRLDLLKSICDKSESHPLFWQMYADELSSDAREQAKVRKLVRRAMRRNVTDPHNFYIMANLYWAQQRFTEAKELYRFAACLKDTNESYVRSYFSASQYFHEQSNAIRFLTNRLKRFGSRSSQPSRTLSWAYEQLGQGQKASEILRDGLRQRPDDSELMLYTADVLARQGQFDEADRCLKEAEARARRVDWLQASALVASYRGEVKSSLSMWQEVAAVEPLNFAATRNTAYGLAQTSGQPAAIAFLRERVAQFPHNLAMYRLLVEWLHEPQEKENALHAMIEIDPVDGWARCELAMVLNDQRQYEKALREAEMAASLEPANGASYNIIGRIQTDLGNIDASKAAYRRAIQLSVDNDFAIANLIAISYSRAERLAALEFVKEELIRQVTFGDGLLAYRKHAQGTLDAQELRQLLETALQARPDLWHAWSALVLQLTDMQRYDEALPLARQASEFFPLVPRIWFDLSLVHQAMLNRQDEIEALQKALLISPGWTLAARQLSEVYTNSGEFDKARTLLEQAIAQNPLDCLNSGYLAEVLWRLGEQEEAIVRIKLAVTIESNYDWAWNRLKTWSGELKREEDFAAFVRERAETRSGEARSWLLIAEMLNRPEDLKERLQALDRANEIDTQSVDAHVLRVHLLVSAHRFDEARAACHPAVFTGTLPVRLRIAAAMVEAESGDHEQGIVQIRAVVTDEPNNYEAWLRLAEWTRLRDSKKEYLEAAEALVRIAPNYSVSLGYLGEARLWNSDRPGAKEAFRRAFILTPKYEFAGFNLFDLQIEDSEIDAARETLQSLKQHVGGDWVTLRELQLALKQKEFDQAADLFRHLCLETQANRELLESALNSMDTNFAADRAEVVLNESLVVPNGNPLAGHIWADRWMKRKAYEKCRKRLEGIIERRAVWYSAAETYLEKLAQSKRSADVRRFIQKNAASLRADNHAWGTVGYALAAIRRHKDVVEWLSDWPSRSSLQPWMLWHYVVALRELNREGEAYRVGRQVMQWPPGYLYDAHRVLIALDDVLANDTESAADQLSQINRDDLREWDQFGYDTASAIAEFSRSPESGMRQLSKLSRLRRTKTFFWKSKQLFNAHRRATMKVARLASNPAVRLWAYLCVAGLYSKKALIVMKLTD